MVGCGALTILLALTRCGPLLTYDRAARDVDGDAIPTGYERVAAFREGVLDGVEGCTTG